MRAEYLTAHVDGEQFFEVVGGDIGDWAGFGQAGVVDQHIQAAKKIGGGLYYPGTYCGRLREIPLNGGGGTAARLNLGYGCGCALVAEGVMTDYGCALAGQFEGDALADSAAIDAGNERPFAGERILVAHITSPACLLSVDTKGAEGPFTTLMSFKLMSGFHSPRCFR